METSHFSQTSYSVTNFLPFWYSRTNGAIPSNRWVLQTGRFAAIAPLA